MRGRVTGAALSLAVLVFTGLAACACEAQGTSPDRPLFVKCETKTIGDPSV